ncbi:ABC transporter substrate-binding protein [Stenotrophomonas sp. GD03993]|uniref:heme/hemin ABC transporter substrate-binding protein n=1 Tax=unclassified Stenotrophomonas TaxID=196198 RepID=UPI00130F95FE|nr:MULTISPECIES: ABC transporter substrate-binding protein [unclassified Stenotrophomonas]MBH1460769.1 ABC transporter substrate-binding protein [Stenotrophomonas maltophilia]MDH0187319.1 ABC transporter substrate-binding protein [Stenotrophomonas sp. GD04051]MDH0464110.1 ABC transporter substrate-binding protein [Stenotrophomonas sp. GD03993]MDH0877815.1 ABC transporter substrate-binding protein [Stenotrophomonas sp. GD03877]MDH2155286.1 ABC transporter substrate-binding protein [Stenotrophom
MNIASRLRLCALPLAVSLALAACGGSSAPSDGKAPAEPPAATAAAAETALPAGWQRVAGAEMPAVHDQKAVLPAKVHSDDGADVEVADTSRIIAGGDDVIAVIEALGLGKQVFAAPTNTTTQAGLAAPHQFLFNRTTGVEGVLSLQGSLFLGNSLRRHTELAKKLREVGEPAVVIDDLQPAPDKVRKVAVALGLAEAGQTLATQVQRQLDEAAAIGKGLGHAPRVIHVSATGAGGSPTVAGADSASAQLIALAGGVNIGTEAGVKNYSQLSNEGVVAAAPEVILVTEHDLQLFGGAEGLWKAYPTLRQTPAGQANRVWVMPDVQLKYTSVGSGAGALALAKAFAAMPKA